MTLDEQGDALMKEAKEINFQYEILVQDICWLEDRIRELYHKVLADPFTMREKNIKDLEFLMTKFRINVEAREKVKAKNKLLGVRINQFFGKDLWGELP